MARLLLSKDAELDHRNKRGQTLLHMAAYGDLPEMCTHLIDKGIEVDVTDNSGSSPLHCTTFSDNIGAAKVLVERGANLRLSDHTSGITPHLWASSYDSPQVLSLLLSKGVDPNYMAPDNGSHALISACHYANTDELPKSVPILIEHGANINYRDGGGNTPLHWAVNWFGGPPLVDYLLKNGADPTIKNNKGLTALDEAKAANKQKLIDLIGNFK